MNNTEIKLLQEVQMQIMDEIHRICCANHLRYYLIGGSAIGAKRHQGIIPWDLDIDIAMPRDDYEQLIKVFPEQCNTKYSLHYYKTDKDFDCPHILVVLNDSTIIFSGDMSHKRYGIFVDVLPLDYCPNEEKKRLKQEKDLLRIKNVIRKQKIRIFPENGLLKRIVKRSIKVFYCSMPRDFINERQQRIMKRYDNCSDCTHWCSMASHYSYEKLSMPKEYFGTPQLMDFSGRQYYVPERIEDYLNQLFGDYTVLPSAEKQKAQMEAVQYAEWRNDKGEIVSVGSFEDKKPI